MAFLKKILNSKKYPATKMGTLCSLISIILGFTYFIPIIMVVSVAFLSEMLVSMLGSQHEGMNAMLFLSAVFIAALLVAFTGVKNLAQKGLAITKKEILMIMFIFYWVVHPLGFYIYWAAFTNFSNDGQMMLGSIFSFPFSSLAFVMIGWMIDEIIKKYTPVSK